MNKSQYLAELSQLLIFMTHTDRERTLARYAALFDAAGPDGQDALVKKLGSTTRQAIRLSRIYDASGYEDAYLDALASSAPEPDAVQEPGPEQQAAPFAARVQEDLPEFGLPDLPDLPEDAAPEPGAETAPPEDGSDAAPEAAPDTASAGRNGTPGEGGDEDADYEELWGKRPPVETPAAPVLEAEQPDEQYEEEDDTGDEDEDEPAQPAAPVWTIEHVIPLWAGVPLFTLSLVFLLLPIALLCLALIPVLVLPGLAVLFGAFLAAVGGLWCISIIADAAVLFGSALILLALGLLILWWGLWLDVAMVSGYARFFRGLADLTLGKKVMVHA